MTTSLLFFGFFLGMKHALEADHVAAVASLATRSASLRDHVRLAGLWGIGHAGAILAAGTIVIALGLSVPASLEQGLEGAIGIVLIVLGADVLRRMRQKRVHFHVHSHGGRRHLHAHSHAGETAHDTSPHEHGHAGGFELKALLVGTLHGLAGTAALVLVSAQATRSAAQAFTYLLLFGLGSVVGMMTLSLAISWPLGISARRFGGFRRGLEGALGTATIALGCWIAAQAGFFGVL